MTTLQEYLNNKYPTKEDKELVEKISIFSIYQERQEQNDSEPLEGGELDLSEFTNLKEIDGEIIVDGEHLLKTPLTKLNLSGCAELTGLFFGYNNLTSVDFLQVLPCPEKLQTLSIYNNNIQFTDIEIFSKFVNLRSLSIGTRIIREDPFAMGKRNKFFGSLSCWKNLDKLESIDFEATDVNEGLEYLPESLIKVYRQRLSGIENFKGYDLSSIWLSIISCQPENDNSNDKCSTIWKQLQSFNYDLAAWQLAHPEKMSIARPELFINEDSKEKWLTALKDKIEKNPEILAYLMENKSPETEIILSEIQKKQSTEQQTSQIEVPPKNT